MSESASPVFDSAEAATKHAIHASGHSVKAVASALWPDRSPAAAHTALLNALNENRAERLTFDQHLFVANFCHRFDLLHYAATRCNHTPPQPCTPAQQVAQIQAAICNQSDQLRALLTQLDLLRSKADVA